MSTGLFANRGHNQGRSFAVHRARQRRRKLDDFAEMLAEGSAPHEAAEALGHQASYGRTLFQRIVKGLGKEQCR